MAGKNSGQYLEDGEVVFIPSIDLFKNYNIIDIKGIGSLEAYTNRNALPYKDLYGLKDAETVFRGTLRNVGWCYTMKKARDLGLFDEEVREDLEGLTYYDMVQKLIECKNSEDILADTAEYLGLEKNSTVIKKLEWLGLFGKDPLPDENNVMDMFSALLQKKLVMEEEDLDLIVLYHHFIVEYDDRKEMITSTLVETGIPAGDSAMSRTVSLPAAIAASMILNGKINMSGVFIPVQPELYNPILDELENMNLVFVEETFPA